MMTLMSSRAGCLWAPFRIFLRGNSPRILLVCMAVGCGIFCTTGVWAQTTYTWNATGGGVWGTAANWTPTRTTPAATDILQFTDGGTYTVTGVPTQTIRQLFVTNGTTVTLQSAAVATLSINGLANTENLSIAAASTLNLGGTTGLTLSFLTTTTQRGNIAGTLGLTGTTNTFATTVITSGTGVTVSGTINNASAGGTVTGSAVSLVFGAAGTYRHARNGGTIPTATWNAASNLDITGITNTAPTPFTGTYGHLTWNCTGQTATAYGISNASTVAGNLSVVAGNFTSGTTTLTVTGTTTVSAGATFTHGTAAKTFTGDITNNGTWNETGAGTFTIAGNLTNNGTFTANTGVHTFSGASKTIDGTTTTLSIPSVTVSGTYTNLVPTFSVGTALAGAGSLSLGTNTVLNLGGTSAITTLNCTANTPNEVVYNGTGAQTAKTTTYHHLTVSKTGSAVLNLNTGTTQVNGDIRITGGVLSDNGNTLSATAGSQLLVSDGAIYRTTKTANFFPANLPFGNINFNTTGGFDYASTSSPYNLPGTPTTYGILYITNGGVNAVRNLSSDIDVHSLVITGSGLDQNGFAITGNAAGSLTLGANGHLRINHASQNFPANFVTANVSLDAASRVTYSYNGTQTVSAVPAAYGDLYTLTGGTKSLVGDVNLLGVLNVGTGTTMDLQGFTMSIAGTSTVVTLNGMLAGDAASSTLRFNAGGSTLQQIGLPVAKLVNGYLANMVCANTGTSVSTLSAATQVSHLNINAGATLNLNGNVLAVSDTYTNTGLLQGATTTAVLELDGTAAQNLALGNVTGTVAFRLRINNAAGVTLSGPALVGGLEFTSGLLHTSTTNLLTINTTTAIGAVTGASASLYVDGPVARRFATGATAGTHVYPVGKSGLNTFALVAPTVSGTTDIRAEVFDADCGGIGGPGLSGLSTTRYWQASVTSGSLTSVTNVQLTEGGLTSTSAIGQSGTQTGTYQLIGGTVAGTSVTSELTVANSLGYFAIGDRIPLHGTVEVGPGSTDGFFTLTANGGLFQAINVRGLDGNVTANIIGDIGIEDGTHALNQWTEYGGSGYTVTVQSSGANRVISGSRATATVGDGLFRLAGADRATFTGGTGTDRKLLFRNTNAGTAANFAATFSFSGDASNNQIDHCQIEGCGLNLSSGVIYVGTGTSTGNDNNTLSNNDIRDLSSASATPAVGIYGLGTSATVTNDNLVILDNNIYNFWSVGATGTNTSSGIHMRTGNASWDIENNRFFQTVTRTTTTGTEQHILFLDNTGANNGGHTVKNNTIGYATAAGTGTLTYSGAATHRFTGIRMNVSSLPVSSVEGNTITAISHTSSSGANTNYAVFSAIYLEAGNTTVRNNTIGSATVSGAIVTNPTSNGAAVWGIRSITTVPSATLLSENTIAGITLTGGTGTANTGVTLEAISSTGGGYAVTGNIIGTASAPLVLSSNATTNATALRGISIAASSAYGYTITNNTISNLQTLNAGTGTQVAGISVSGGAQYQINGNSVFALGSAAANTGTGASASVVGIGLVTSNTQMCTVNANSVHDLNNTYSSTAAVSVTGIAYNGGSSMSNSISGNLVHSLNNGGNTASQILGIQVVSGSGIATVSNNMIRLGLKTDGSPVANHLVIAGLEDASTGAQKFYNNTVYVGGTTSTAVVASTYAFRRTATSGADVIQNNILANDRTGGTAGTSYHLAFGNSNVTGLTAANFDYNVFYSRDNEEFAPTGTPMAGATPALRMQALRAGAPVGSNLHSGVATLPQINFVNATGNAATLSLRLGDNTCAARAGISLADVAVDFDVTSRPPAPAIGAHESVSFVALDAAYDIYTPNFTFSNIPAQSAACVPPQPITVDVTVTDVGTGSPTSGTHVPQMWWRVSTGAYVAVAGTLVSGTGNNGLWRFTVNPTLSVGETYHYYFVAEDQAAAANRWFTKYEAATPVHPQVYDQTTPTAAPSTFSVISTTPLSGTVTVGPGGTYTSFGAVGGLFEAIANNGLSGDLTALVTGNITDNNVYSLTQWAEYCGSGYYLRIRPQTTGMKVVSVTAANGFGFGFIKLQGADRVVIDGSFNGSGNNLTFRNLYTSTANVAGAIYLDGTCENDTLRNITIEGQGHHPQGGNLIINTATGSSVYVKDCTIKGVASNQVPNNLVYSATSGAGEYTLTGCNLYDFSNFGSSVSGQRATGILINGSLNPTATWTITDNNIYNTFIDGQGPQTALDFSPGAGSSGTISGNYIGGSSPQCGTGGAVAYWGNSWDNYFGTENQLRAVVLNAGPVTFSQNTIQNFRVTNSDYSSFLGIWTLGATAPTITDNTIGNSNSAQSIRVSGGGVVGEMNPGYVYGLYNQSSGPLVLENNNFYYLGQLGAYTGGQAIPIYLATSANFSVKNNHIQGCQSAGIGFNSFGIRISPVSGTANGTLEENVVDGPYLTSNTGSFFPLNAAIYTTGSVNATFSHNRILDMRSAYVSGISLGMYLTGSGNYTLKNNYVSLSNAGNTIRMSLYGIADELTSGSVLNCYNNTVVISGSQTSGGSLDNSSYAFYRNPAGAGFGGTAIGSTVDLKNNIFINSRTGGNTLSFHVGVANIGGANHGIGWGANASNYNLICVSPNADRGRYGVWGTGAFNQFVNWQAAGSGNDTNSWAVFTTTGAGSATALNPSELFTDVLLGDLSIKTDNQAAWFVNGKGIAGAASGNSSRDFGGDSRETTYGLGIDIGADEFTPDAGVLPHALTGTPTAGGTNTFTFAGRTVGSITWGWGGTLPSVITARYYSGDAPGTDPSPVYGGTSKADFMLHYEPTGGSGYAYTASLHYDEAQLGDYVGTETHMQMIKTVSSDWTGITSTVDTVANILTNSGSLFSFSFFSAGVPPTPLPVELLNFEARCDGTSVKLLWATASEINNDRFTVHRSADLITWEEILTIPGAGNSNAELAYQAYDERPLDGLAYYRLTQTDFDGTFETFQPVSVDCEKSADNGLFIYPNPAAEHFTVAITVDHDVVDATLEVVDINGKRMFTKSVSLTSGSTEWTFTREMLPSGTYTVWLKAQNVVVKPAKLVVR